MLAVEMIDAVLLFYESGTLHQIPTRAGEAVCSPVGEAVTTLRAGKAAVVAAGDLAALLEALGVSETVEEMS